MNTALFRMPLRIVRHLFLDRSYEGYYSAKVWDDKYRRENYDLGDAKEDARYGALLQILRRYDHGALIDLGCGDGLLWKYYRPLSKSVLVGVDYAEAAIAKAVALDLPDARFACGDYRNFNPGQMFSAAVFNESLYYIDDFMAAMHAAQAFLDENGVVIVSMFDTLVTRRIWKQLLRELPVLQSAGVRDHASGRSWTIRVFPKARAVEQ